MKDFLDKLTSTAWRKVILSAVALCCSVHLSAQMATQKYKDKQVSFPSRSITIESAFRQIESQVDGIKISVSHTDFDISRKVRLSSTSLTMGQALDQLLSPSRRSYLISGNLVMVLPPRSKQASEQPAASMVATAAEAKADNIPDSIFFSSAPTYQLITPSFALEAPRTTDLSRATMARSVVGHTFYLRAPMSMGIKTNLLYGAGTLTPNLSVELGLARNKTLDLGGSYNWWNLNGSYGAGNNRKLAHWIAQGEYRYWLCERFNGHFFGVHALYSMYNIADHELPLLFGKGSGNHRYKGYMVGAGVSYGYDFMLGKHWNLEMNIGVGYGYMRYDQFECDHCGELIKTNVQRNYFGPTKGGISLVYLIK